MLIIERDASARAFTRTLLRREGVSVEAVGDADGAMKVLGARQYKVVLLDLDLGDSDAFDVLDFMARKKIDTPVLVTSEGAGDVVDRARQSRLVHSVITKPIDSDNLIAMVQKFC